MADFEKDKPENEEVAETEVTTETNDEAVTDSKAATPAKEKKAPKAKESKSKKATPNFFVRMGRRIKKFWKEYVSELKKVAWMSWKDVKKNTLLVVCAVAVFSVAIGILDATFGGIIDGFANMVG